MAGANTNIQLSGLDFSDIKNNLKLFLQSQETFKDYNFDGAGLSVLLDILAYNTQYNAFYLNMVANEMFLDTALQRSSVVSHAKLLNYTPMSSTCPTATVDIYVSGVTSSSLTLPAYTTFLSESVAGVNYNFLTTDSTTVNADVANNIAIFSDVEIKQGILANFQYTVNGTTNPSYTFTVPDSLIDTKTLLVSIQQSSTNTYSEVYTLANEYLTLNGDSKVYFLQESINGNYEIYFGDGILGKKLTDGNIVNMSYIITQGTSSQGANNFVIMDTLPGFTNTTIFGKIPATKGGERETIDSIKFQAPKNYAAQKRAITKEDYITILQQNTIGVSFDAVNVWGGEENNPPEYGKVFIAIKPSGSYVLTENQKQQILNKVLAPVSVLTVTPQLVDIDYVYLILEADVLYDSKKTNLTSAQIGDLVKQGTYTYCNSILNTFDSTFVVGDLINYIQSLNKAIIAVDYDVFLQKRISPILGSIQDYTIKFGSPIEKAVLSTESMGFSPSFGQYDDQGNFYPEVYMEESPDVTTNIHSVTLINGGSNYTKPTVTISGDGTGAFATATVKNGIITSIDIISEGAGYTQAGITITDSSGSGALATAVLKTNAGDLRTYYFVNGIKNILRGATHTNRAGYVDYTTGTVDLLSFAPVTINSTDGVLKIKGYSEKRIISSTYDRIVTIDEFDPESVTVTVTTK